MVRYRVRERTRWEMATDGNAAGSGTLVFAGLLTLDVAQITASLPDLGGKATSEAAYMDVGGPAANAAITAAGLGADVLLHTVVGTGEQAEFVGRALARYAVPTTDHATDANVPLAGVWVLAGTGERTILATNNAHLELRPEGRLLPEDTAAVLLDGHYPGLARAVVGEAEAAGVPIVLDCGRWRPIFSELLPLAAEVIMCESFRPPNIVASSGEALVGGVVEAWQPAVCAMSRGAKDLLVAVEGALHNMAVPQVDVVDTTGAGDVLHGAYVYFRYVEQMDPIEALRRSAAMASESCSHLAVRRLADKA